MTFVRRGCVVAMALAGVLAQPLWGHAAEQSDVADPAKTAPTRRDAAEVVKEGDMSQWLQYYQRERGDGWSKPSAPPPADPTASKAKPSDVKAQEAQTPSTPQR